MDNLEQGQNTGVYIQPRETDFLAGAESAIVFEERLSSGNWEVYKPSDEWQRRKIGNNLGYDTLSCVTFSALNSVEAQIIHLLNEKRIPDGDVKLMQHLGYLDENGKPDFSDWFSAILNGTSENGNYLQAPWDNFRKMGILPQKDGKTVNDFKSQKEWLDPNNITDAMKAKAKMFLEIFDVSYEWVVRGAYPAQAVFDTHIKHAPLHALLPTYNGWNTKDGIVPAREDVRTVNHAVLYIGKGADFVKILDHYNPFVKHLENGYYIPYAIKGVITPKKSKPTTPPSWTYVFSKQLTYGDAPSHEVTMLQTALQTLKDGAGKPYMSVGVFGRFGDITRNALGRFQTDNGINDPDGQGTNFGVKTRGAMNAKLAIHT